MYRLQMHNDIVFAQEVMAIAELRQFPYVLFCSIERWYT
jgi:hypothetical protein